MAKVREHRFRKDGTPWQPAGRITANVSRLLFKSLKLVPMHLTGVALISVMYGVYKAVYTLFTVRLFNELDAGTGAEKIMKIIIAMAVFVTVYFAIHNVYRFLVKPLTKLKLNLAMHRELFEKVRSADISCYDDPEFYDDFVWSMNEAGSRTGTVIDDLGNLISAVTGFVAVLSVILTIDPAVAAALFLLSVWQLLMDVRWNKISYRWGREAQPLWRRINYVAGLFRGSGFAKEMRTSGAEELIMDRYHSAYEEMIGVQTKYQKKWFMTIGLFSNVVTNILYFGILVFMFLRLSGGSIQLGGFAASVTVIWSFTNRLRAIIDSATTFQKHSLFLERYYAFIDYKPSVTYGPDEPGEFETLELRNVSFTYDFSKLPKYGYHDKDWKQPAGGHDGPPDALKNVSLTLKRGEHAAIVGYNGAGKTTLIKLIMRFYDPTSGEILYNGKNIKEYKLGAYRDRIGAVFQDFRIFAATIGENVVNGDYEEARDRQTVEKALDAVGFSDKLATLEKGVDTVLTREFDKSGTILSGGEGQKIAIARVFARPYDLIIMDEPSASLDPMAEYGLNRAIAEYAEGRTVIFISHRLSTTRMADRIYMFSGGELAESGTHDELMKLGGRYAEMFNVQAERYRRI